MKLLKRKKSKCRNHLYKGQSVEHTFSLMDIPENVEMDYSLFQKKRTFNSDFFLGPPGGGGPKLHMVDYVNGSSTHAQFF